MDIVDSGPNRDNLQSQLASLDAEHRQGSYSGVEQGHSSPDLPDAGPDRSRYDLRYVHSYRVHWYDNLYIAYCIVVYLADVTTDVIVLEQYFSNGDYVWFSLTLFFIIFAHVIMLAFSIKWHYDDLAKEASKRRIILLNILSLGPILRYWQVYKTGKKTCKDDESRVKYNSILFEQWRDLTMLRLFEAFIESGPQMVLQLYILAYSRSFNEQEDWKTAFSACCSLLSLSSSIVSYSKALRDARIDRGKMSYWAFACQLVWRITMVASRIITLVLFASVYKTWLLLVLIPHFFASVIWVYFQDTSLYKRKIWKAVHSVSVAFIYIFCFFNTKDGPTRLRLVIFYVIMFVEMVVLMGLWLPYRNEYGVVFIAAVSWVFGGFLIGVLAMILYYQCYHPSLPTQGLCFRTKHDIPTSREAKWYYPCCGCGCKVRDVEEEEMRSEGPSPRDILVDIPATSGSVGRSFERESSPPFESEWLDRRPSEAQRKHSLEKHKRKKLQEERIQRLKHEAKNRQVVSLDNMNTTQPSNNHANGTHPGYARTAVRDDGEEDDDVTTTVVYHGTCDDGVHCGTDDEQRTEIQSKTCDDGVHCGTDDEQETEIKSKTCDDGVHCETDDEQETEIKSKTCDDGVHCGTDDEQETEIKSKTCDDGVHCETDDEQETEIKSKTCNDGVHCGTDDEQETSNERTIRINCAHCATNKNQDATVSSTSMKPTTENTAKSNTPNSLYPLLTFDNRYSIVSDCISLSSGSSNEIQDEEPLVEANPKSPKRRIKTDKVNFPNFVASTLNRGKFSSLRLSRENVIMEEREASRIGRRHTVDFSQLNAQSNTDYVAFITNLKPKRFGSVRDCTQPSKVKTI